MLPCIPACGRLAARFTVSFLLAAMLATVLAPTAWAGTQTVVLLTDTHIGADASVNKDTLAAFKYAKKQKHLAAVVNCGDVTNVGAESEYRTYLRLWKKSGVKAARVQAIGNHDNATGGYKNWLRHAHCKGYNRNTGIRLFKTLLNGGKLNTVTKLEHANIITIGQGVKQNGGIITNKMVKWLNTQLEKTVRAGKTAIVVCHYAPWQAHNESFTEEIPNMNKLMGVCQSYPNVVFACGHEHVYDNNQKFMKYHHSNAAKNRYKRSGIDASKACYPVRLLCLAAASRVKGVFGEVDPVRHSHVYTLTMKDDGSARLVDRDMTKKKSVCRASFKQSKSSITVSASVAKGLVAKLDAENPTVSFKVSFSDGGTYGGVKSGGTFALAPDASKELGGIPSGVLVTAEPTTKIAGAKTPGKQALEVTKKAQKMGFAYA